MAVSSKLPFEVLIAILVKYLRCGSLIKLYVIFTYLYFAGIAFDRTPIQTESEGVAIVAMVT